MARIMILEIPDSEISQFEAKLPAVAHSAENVSVEELNTFSFYLSGLTRLNETMRQREPEIERLKADTQRLAAETQARLAEMERRLANVA